MDKKSTENTGGRSITVRFSEVVEKTDNIRVTKKRTVDFLINDIEGLKKYIGSISSTSNVLYTTASYARANANANHFPDLIYIDAVDFGVVVGFEGYSASICKDYVDNTFDYQFIYGLIRSDFASVTVKTMSSFSDELKAFIKHEDMVDKVFDDATKIVNSAFVPGFMLNILNNPMEDQMTLFHKLRKDAIDLGIPIISAVQKDANKPVDIAKTGFDFGASLNKRPPLVSTTEKGKNMTLEEMDKYIKALGFAELLKDHSYEIMDVVEKVIDAKATVERLKNNMQNLNLRIEKLSDEEVIKKDNDAVESSIEMANAVIAKSKYIRGESAIHIAFGNKEKEFNESICNHYMEGENMTLKDLEDMVHEQEACTLKELLETTGEDKSDPLVKIFSALVSGCYVDPNIQFLTVKKLEEFVLNRKHGFIVGLGDEGDKLCKHIYDYVVSRIAGREELTKLKNDVENFISCGKLLDGETILQGLKLGGLGFNITDCIKSLGVPPAYLTCELNADEMLAQMFKLGTESRRDSLTARSKAKLEGNIAYGEYGKKELEKQKNADKIQKMYLDSANARVAKVVEKVKGDDGVALKEFIEYQKADAKVAKDELQKMLSAKCLMSNDPEPLEANMIDNNELQIADLEVYLIDNKFPSRFTRNTMTLKPGCRVRELHHALFLIGQNSTKNYKCEITGRKGMCTQFRFNIVVRFGDLRYTYSFDKNKVMMAQWKEILASPLLAEVTNKYFYRKESATTGDIEYYPISSKYRVPKKNNVKKEKQSTNGRTACFSSREVVGPKSNGRYGSKGVISSLPGEVVVPEEKLSYAIEDVVKRTRVSTGELVVHTARYENGIMHVRQFSPAKIINATDLKEWLADFEHIPCNSIVFVEHNKMTRENLVDPMMANYKGVEKNARVLYVQMPGGCFCLTTQPDWNQYQVGEYMEKVKWNLLKSKFLKRDSALGSYNLVPERRCQVKNEPTNYIRDVIERATKYVDHDNIVIHFASYNNGHVQVKQSTRFEVLSAREMILWVQNMQRMYDNHLCHVQTSQITDSTLVRFMTKPGDFVMYIQFHDGIIMLNNPKLNNNSEAGCDAFHSLRQRTLVSKFLKRDLKYSLDNVSNNA